MLYLQVLHTFPIKATTHVSTLQSMQLILYLQVLHTFPIKVTTHVSTLHSMQLVRGESSLIEVLEGLLKVRHELSI